MGLIAVDNFTGTEYYVDAINGSDSTGSSEGLSAGNAFQTLYYAIHTGIPFYGANTTNGDRVNLLANSTHNISTAINLPGTRGNGTDAAPVIVQGCTATPNDGGIANLNNARGGNSQANSGNWNFKFVDLKITSDGGKWSSSSGRAEYYNCWIKAENGNGEFIYSSNDDFYYCTIEFQNHDFRYSLTLVNCVVIEHSNRPICTWWSNNSIGASGCLFINNAPTFTSHIINLTSCSYSAAIAINGNGISGTGIRYHSGSHLHVENVGTAFYTYYANGGARTVDCSYYNCTTGLSGQTGVIGYDLSFAPTLLSNSLFSNATSSSIILDTATNNLDAIAIGNITAGGLNVSAYEAIGFGIGLPAGGGSTVKGVAGIERLK
jgi:hypothetical protein